MKHISSCNTVSADLCLDGGSFFCPSFYPGLGILCLFLKELVAFHLNVKITS
uniref:Uncharacterized protein n=1 Tax=Arundo donax TaxID=35708 RepID=A0A0A9H0C5_ARUDO